MTKAEVDLNQLEADCRETRAQDSPQLAVVGTHWQGCWTEHPLCALPIVEDLVAALREAGKRQVTLDRTVLHFLQRRERTMSSSDFDDEQKTEIARIARVWGVQVR